MWMLCIFLLAPALALNGPRLQLQPQQDEHLDEEQQSPEQPPGILDNIMWMAAPKKRRSIEINRTRRRAVEKLIKVKVWVKCINLGRWYIWREILLTSYNMSLLFVIILSNSLFFPALTRLAWFLPFLFMSPSTPVPSIYHVLIQTPYFQTLLNSQDNVVPCLECGHLKQKHVLCGFCYEKVRRETSLIRIQINAQEGGPLKAPATETVVLYEGEMPGDQDQDKRIVERARKRPTWFT